MNLKRAKLVTGGFVVAAAMTLSSACALADDTAQVAPTTNSTAPVMAPAGGPQGTTKILGTIQGNEVTTPPPNTTPAPGTTVPAVAPIAPPTEPWTAVLPRQNAGGIEYVTGGIGDDERSALGEAKKEFNLYIMSANKDGSFVGDTQIAIRSAKGDTLLNVTAGPLLYVKLPAGTYTVEASFEGKSNKEKITIGTKGAANVNFSW